MTRPRRRGYPPRGYHFRPGTGDRGPYHALHRGHRTGNHAKRTKKARKAPETRQGYTPPSNGDRGGKGPCKPSQGRGPSPDHSRRPQPPGTLNRGRKNPRKAESNQNAYSPHGIRVSRIFLVKNHRIEDLFFPGFFLLKAKIWKGTLF